MKKTRCDECRGLGHVPLCCCKGPAASIIGCCQRCAGEGLVSVKEGEDPPVTVTASMAAVAGELYELAETLVAEHDKRENRRTRGEHRQCLCEQCVRLIHVLEKARPPV